MKYINTTTKEYPLSMLDIRAQNPNISIPLSATTEMIESLGYADVKLSKQPEYNPLTHKAIETTPKLSKGVYHENYEVVPLTQEEFATGMTAKRIELEDAVEEMLDAQAKTMSYTNMERATTYVPSKIEKFSTDALALVHWRDDVWVACYAILDGVLAGNRPIPTIEELLAELPKFEVTNNA